MHLRVITPQREVLKTEIDHVILPSVWGEIDILPGHAQLVSLLEEGVVAFFRNGTTQKIKIGNGSVEVANDNVCVLVSEATALEAVFESP